MGFNEVFKRMTKKIKASVLLIEPMNGHPLFNEEFGGKNIDSIKS